MEDNHNQDIYHNDEFTDSQERLFLRLNLIQNAQTKHKNSLITKFKNNPRFNKYIDELKKLKIILHFVILLGIFFFFIFILIKINYIIIILDLSVVLSYISFLKYIYSRYKNKFKISKRDLKFIIRSKFNFKTYSFYQLIIDIIIIIFSLFLLIISFIMANLIIFISILVVTIVYINTEKYL